MSSKGALIIVITALAGAVLGIVGYNAMSSEAKNGEQPFFASVLQQAFGTNRENESIETIALDRSRERTVSSTTTSGNANVRQTVTSVRTVPPGEKKNSTEPVSQKNCTPSAGGVPLHAPVIISEVAWMGSVESARDEWIEIANISSSSISLFGWQLVDGDEEVTVRIGSKNKVLPGDFFILARSGGAVASRAQATFTGSIRNTDEAIHLYDASCALVDEVRAAPSWAAGDNESKRTMERNLGTLLWHTAAVVGGTPGTKNSTPLSEKQAVSSAEQKQKTSSSVTVQKVLDQSELSVCAKDSTAVPTHAVLINEVAWAGTGSETTSHEWIELANPTASPIAIAGWQLSNNTGDLTIHFSKIASIVGGGFFLLERTDDTRVPHVPADAFFTGVIRNNGESLSLFSESCALVDTVVANQGSDESWSAGTAAPEYRTAERADDLSWKTYSGPSTYGVFGTPRTSNSRPAPPQPDPTPIVGGGGNTNQPPPPDPPPQSDVALRVLVSEVMVGSEANADDEFIELYNAGDALVTLSGWSIKKKSSSGTESSLVAASRLEGKTIPPHGYFLFAHDGAYGGATVPDVVWPASYSLASTNNAVILRDAAGTRIEEVVWQDIPRGKSTTRVSWDGNSFVISDVPSPQNSGGQ